MAAGLTDPVSRPAYLDALRRAARSRRTGTPPGGCRVCGSPRVRSRTITSAHFSDRTIRIVECRVCGFIGIPKGRSSYHDVTDLDEIRVRTSGTVRVGTHETPGREYQMARMAVDILARRDPVDVLVYGAGRSVDNVHIARLDGVDHVAIGDIVRLRDDADFVDVGRPSSGRRFHVVIASEVVEHFREPRADFDTLFSFVASDGLLVCGTNVYGGWRLSKDRYPFFHDHTAYYSPESLLRIATRAGYRIDFRPTGLSRGRKRYVLLSRSERVMSRVACYFGTRTYAPSEARPEPEPGTPRAPRRETS
ncbi:UNVERIFIED_CONTAM: hypothetical protein LK11_13205 [Mumia flava]